MLMLCLMPCEAQWALYRNSVYQFPVDFNVFNKKFEAPLERSAGGKPM